MPGTYESIREQIMVALAARLTAMATPTYGLAFDTVTRNELGSDIKNKKYVVGVYDDDENNSPDTDPVMRREISVELEFQVYIAATETARTIMNMVFSEVERALKSDRTFGGLAIDLKVDRTQTSITGRFDNYAEGLMFARIQYRTNNSDPRLAV